MYVLSDGFQGNVVILFDQPGGAPAEYSNKYRVYRIPQSGIMKTVFKSDHAGFAARRFCYASQFRGVDSTPETAYLPYVGTLNTSTTKLAATTIVCFNHDGFTQGQARVGTFSVSSVAQADSVFALREALLEQVLPPFRGLAWYPDRQPLARE